MRRGRIVTVILFLIVFLFVFLNIPQASDNSLNSDFSISDDDKDYKEYLNNEEIVILTVACNSRIREALNMIKSAILFNTDRRALKFVIYADPNSFQQLDKTLKQWKSMINFDLKYELHPPWFPNDKRIDWSHSFRPCATQRLFLPQILIHLDAVIYVDSDVIFVSPVSELWAHFSKFNSSQIAATTMENEYKEGWYINRARSGQNKFGVFGERGLQSGVMLFNYTRMRNLTVKWEQSVSDIYEKYRHQIALIDQDIFNIFFYNHSDKMFVMSCAWNFRSTHCCWGLKCHAPDGIKLIHGAALSFSNGFHDKIGQPLIENFYKAIDEYAPGTNPYENIVQRIEKAITANKTKCDEFLNLYLKTSRKILGGKNYVNPFQLEADKLKEFSNYKNKIK